MGRKDKALIKENQKQFFKYEGQILLRNGFKRRKGAYWRIAGDEILQIVVPGLLKEENENIFFDLIPLYSYIHDINEKEVFYLPKINIKDICEGNGSFDEQLMCFRKNIVPVFDNVIDAESLLTFHSNWNIEEICKIYKATKKLKERYFAEYKTFLDERYPFIELLEPPTILNEDATYAAIRCKKYGLALESLNDKFYRKISIIDFELMKGCLNKEDYEEKKKRIKDIFRGDLEIMHALETNNVDKIEYLLEENIEYNRRILRRILG